MIHTIRVEHGWVVACRPIGTAVVVTFVPRLSRLRPFRSMKLGK